jgi:hypothetical protein
VHVPDVVEPGAVAEQPVADEREPVGERENLREPGEEAGQGTDRKERAGEEPGTIAIAGTRAMYSSALGTRLARVSAAPYMPTVKRAVAAMNQTMPVPAALK